MNRGLLELPVGERLKALEAHLNTYNDDNDSGSGAEDLDLAAFYRKRQQELHSDVEEPEAEKDTQLRDFTLSQSGTLHNAVLDAKLAKITNEMIDALSSDSEPDPEADLEPETAHNLGLEGISAAMSSPPREFVRSNSPVRPAANARARVLDSDSDSDSDNEANGVLDTKMESLADDDKLLDEIRKAAGIDGPDSPEPRPQTQRVTKASRELAAQETARQKRGLDLRVPTHTVATATVDSFLDAFDRAVPQQPRSTPPSIDLDSDIDDLEVVSTPPSSPLSRHRQLLSSSPLGKMKWRQRADPGPKIAMKTKNMLLDAMERQREQAAEHRRTRIETLKAQGVEIVSEQQQVMEKDMAEEMLERERMRAEELQKMEKKQRKGRSILDFDDSDDSSPDLPSNPAADGDYSGSEDDDAAMLSLSGSDFDEPAAQVDVDDSGSDVDVGADDEPALSQHSEHSDADDESDEMVSDRDSSIPAGKRRVMVSDSDESDGETTAQQPVGLRRAQPEGTQVLPRVDSAFATRLLKQRTAAAAGVDLDAIEEAELVSGPEVDLANMTLDSDSSANDDVNDALAQLRPEIPNLKALADSSMSASQQQEEMREMYKKSRTRHLEAREWIEDQAEESDDEWAGMGGPSDDDKGDDADQPDVEGLVDNSAVNVGAKKLQQMHNQQQLERDEKAVKRLVEDVNGGWRRRRAGHGLYDGLSDSDSDHEEQMERRRQKEKQRRDKMLENDDMARLAGDVKTKAFLESLAADVVTRPTAVRTITTAASVQESLRFLEDDEEDHAELHVDFMEDEPLDFEVLRPASLRIRDRPIVRPARAVSKPSSVSRMSVEPHANRNSTAPPAAFQAPRKKKARVLVAPKHPSKAGPTPVAAAALFKRTWN